MRNQLEERTFALRKEQTGEPTVQTIRPSASAARQIIVMRGGVSSVCGQCRSARCIHGKFII